MVFPYRNGALVGRARSRSGGERDRTVEVSKNCSLAKISSAKTCSGLVTSSSSFGVIETTRSSLVKAKGGACRVISTQSVTDPDGPRTGFVLKEGFLGRQSALSVRDALTELAQSEAFHEAKVVAGGRGKGRESCSSASSQTTGGGTGARTQEGVAGAGFAQCGADTVRYLRDGARFVKHLETYSNAQRDERSAMSKDGLVRLVTRVYYLHDEREPDHGGELRVHLENSKHLPASHWEFPPKLDTLMVFRSLDVEHEVLQTYRERKAVTIWYYGKATKVSARSAGIAVPRALLSITGEQAVHAKQASIFVAIPSHRDSECRHTVDNLLAQLIEFPLAFACRWTTTNVSREKKYAAPESACGGNRK
ncbi:hypothetical protein ON010_g1954 [Phytophthora cinnamomi]|nr:hypothetical protein ON010_g1954 [Phytophthora cinnamomi]